ncbi:carbohydrate-binding protein [Pontiellaceae bacterium B12227]|nr:carbohydrate-binding protein [Pontiellaceae bacterium B12227]
MRRIATILSLCIVWLSSHSARANWFTNDLTDATSVAAFFNENLSPSGNGVWSYASDYAQAQDGTLNTELQGGAVIDFVTTDDDSARSYLATEFSNYADSSWTAHIAVETVNEAPKNKIFFGLGAGDVNSSDSYKPTSGDHVYISWQSGNSGSKVTVFGNSTTITNTGKWQGDPGYDIYMHYDHEAQTIEFEIDNWNGGRYSDVDISVGPLAVDSYLNDADNMSIFFGGNATMTFRDFYVEEKFRCVHPGIPLTVEDLDLIKANLNNEPWATGYADLVSDSHSSLDYEMKGPFAEVGRTTNSSAWENDMGAVHNLALMWYFTEDEAYAQKGRDILISWATNHTEFLSGETYLTMGYNAWLVFEGADILRGTWPGWTVEDTETCKTYFENVWWDETHIALPGPLRSANQGASQYAAALGVAIFNDDEEKFNLCLQAFRADPCGGLMDSLPNGQVGDTGRDAHSQGEIQLQTWAAEVFWKQGIDVYAEHDNRLLAAGEYYSRVAMNFDTPFVTAGTVYDIYPELNSLAASNHTYFIGPRSFNMLQGAYVVRKGMSAPYLEEYLSCFEQDADSFCYLKPADTSTAAVPAALTEPAGVASVTSLNGVNMGNCTSGSQSYSSGTWSVSGRGSRMYYSSDPDYHFSYLPVTGDATIIAQLTGISGGSSTDARAGLVFTESIGNNDEMAAVVVTAEDADDELQTWYRGYSASSHMADNHGKPNQPKPRMPYWLKIERIDERITLFTSPDGASWSTAGCADYNGLSSTAYFGLAVSSDEYSSTATATFTDVRITGGDGGEASTVPAAPFAIYASPGGDQVPLRWLESFEADSYKIWRSNVSGGPYTLLTQEAGTSFIDTNVVAGTRYFYAVSAVNAYGESAKSPEETFHYRATYIEAEDYDAQSGIKYPLSCQDWCGGYKVGNISNNDWCRYDNIQIAADSVFRARATSGQTNTTGRIDVYLDSTSGTPIASVDVPYTGDFSQKWGTFESEVVAVSGTHDVILKFIETGGTTGKALFDLNWFGFISTNVAPGNLAIVAVSPTQIDLSWSPVGSATEYVVKRSQVSGGPYAEVGRFTTTGCSDAELDAGTTYYYVVSALIDDLETIDSAEATVDTVAQPDTPDIFYSTLDSHPLEISLHWSAVSNATGYVVRRTGTSGSNYQMISSNVTELMYVDSEIEAHETYYYTVSAVNEMVESEPSEEVTGVGIPYEIVGDESSYLSEKPWFDRGNLFDNDIAEYFDSRSPYGGWIGLDFGEERQVQQIDYVLRNWNPYAYRNCTNSTFEGANSPDFSDAVVLHTILPDVQTWPTVNSISVTNTSGFRYVRLKARSDKPLFSFAEVDFVTVSAAPTVTANGTPVTWLEIYELLEADDDLDSDGDGLLTWQEYLAGTNPTNDGSVLKVNSVEEGGTGMVVSWQSVAGKSYSIITNGSLSAPNKGTAVSGIVGKDGETSHTTTVNNAEAMFFEVGVE